jgi:hypothetical protein
MFKRPYLYTEMACSVSWGSVCVTRLDMISPFHRDRPILAVLRAAAPSCARRAPRLRGSPDQSGLDGRSWAHLTRLLAGASAYWDDSAAGAKIVAQKLRSGNPAGSRVCAAVWVPPMIKFRQAIRR